MFGTCISVFQWWFTQSFTRCSWRTSAYAKTRHPAYHAAWLLDPAHEHSIRLGTISLDHSRQKCMQRVSLNKNIAQLYLNSFYYHCIYSELTWSHFLRLKATIYFQHRSTMSSPYKILFMVATLRIDSCKHFQEMNSQMQPRRVTCHCAIGARYV